MASRTVLLYGQSLLLAGVATGIDHCADLQMVRAATWTEATRLLAQRIPDVVIFDLNGTCESQILPLLLVNPRLLLLGLDVERDRAVLLAGQKTRPLTLAEIKEIVQREDAL